MAAAASAGSRGAGRQATGRAADGPPARCRAPTSHLREPEGGRGAAPRSQSPSPSALLSPPGGLEPRTRGPSWSCEDPPGSSSPRPHSSSSLRILLNIVLQRVGLKATFLLLMGREPVSILPPAPIS
ncbi:uncharacterized protein WM277_000628 [Molossus nigricans]